MVPMASGGGREKSPFWGAQLGHNASWQMEVYRKDDGAAISGGLADYEFGHWAKTVRPDESFRTPAATLTVCKCDTIDEASDRLVSAMRVPDIASEQELPILFNEYCTTWGCPSHENIANILSAIQDKGISYFVIDAGWYKPEGIPWENAWETGGFQKSFSRKDWKRRWRRSKRPG